MLGLLGTLGTIGSVAAPFINMWQQKKTNDTSREIAQLNNEFNASEAQKMRDYNTEMWNANNRYNSPEQQVERLRAAGLNPAFALGQVAGGQVSSQPSAGSPASSSGNLNLSAPQLGIEYMQHQLLEKQLDLMNSERESVDEDVRGKIIDNETKALHNRATIDSIMANTKDVNARRYYQEIQNKNAQRQIDAQVERDIAQKQSLQANARNAIAQAISVEIRNLSLPQQVKLELEQISADIIMKTASGDLSYSQAKKVFQEETKQFLDNKMMEQTWDMIINKVKYDQRNQGFYGSLNNLIQWMYDKDF